VWDAQSMYGVTPQVSTQVLQPTTLPGTDGGDFGSGWRALVNPDNPLFWAGVLILATVGAAGVAGSARLGPARIAAGVGKS
jgi:hypothetical protein